MAGLSADCDDFNVAFYGSSPDFAGGQVRHDLDLDHGQAESVIQAARQEWARGRVWQPLVPAGAPAGVGAQGDDSEGKVKVKGSGGGGAAAAASNKGVVREGFICPECLAEFMTADVLIEHASLCGHSSGSEAEAGAGPTPTSSGAEDVEGAHDPDPDGCEPDDGELSSSLSSSQGLRSMLSTALRAVSTSFVPKNPWGVPKPINDPTPEEFERGGRAPASSRSSPGGSPVFVTPASSMPGTPATTPRRHAKPPASPPPPLPSPPPPPPHHTAGEGAAHAAPASGLALLPPPADFVAVPLAQAAPGKRRMMRAASVGREPGMTRYIDPSKLTKAAVVSGVPSDTEEDVAWWENFCFKLEGTDRPTASHTRQMVKAAARAPIPCQCRGAAWLYVTGGAALLQARPTMYEEAKEAVLGGTSNFRVPQDTEDPSLKQMCLSQAGLKKAGLIVQCLCYEHCEIQDYCPWVQMVVAACLHFMTEAETFALVSALIREPSPFLISKVSSWNMVDAFERVAREMLPGGFDSLCRFMGTSATPELDEKHPLCGVVSEWLAALAFWPLMRLLDFFIVERASTIFFRFGAAVLHSWAGTITRRPSHRFGRSDTGPAWLNPTATAQTMVDPEALVKAALAVSNGLSSSDINRAKLKGHRRAVHAATATGRSLGVGERRLSQQDGSNDSTFGILPSVEVPDNLETVCEESVWVPLWNNIPTRFKWKSAQLFFTTAEHGYSLKSFYQHCGEEAPTILVVKTMSGDSFGCFIPHPWSERHNVSGYFGSPETFLFALTPSYEHFEWVGLSSQARDSAVPGGDQESTLVPPASFFMHATQSTIAIGGGGAGHALELDSELCHGSSHTCDTFKNPVLSSGGRNDFKCATVEVWKFVSRTNC